MRRAAFALGVCLIVACDPKSSPAPAASAPSQTAGTPKSPLAAARGNGVLGRRPLGTHAILHPDIAPSPSGVASAKPGVAKPASVFAKGAVNVLALPSRDAMQIGMLALGDAADVDGEPVASPACAGGFAKLSPAGFVCLGPDATRDGTDTVVALARSEGRPSPGSAYPFSYGESLGAPVYARVPTEAEQTRIEPQLEAQRAVIATARRAAMLGKDDEIPAHLRGVELTAHADPCPAALLTHKDGEPPLARMATLAPRAGVAWVTECEAEGRTWLVTPELTVVPRDRVARALASTAHGVESPAGVAFVTIKPRPRYRMVRYGYFEAQGPPLPVGTAVRLTGQKHAVGAATYLETTTNGEYVLADHVVVVEPLPRPSGVGAREKWLDLDTRRGLLVAYEGDVVMFAALVAAPVVTADEVPGRLSRGRTRIEWKHRSHTLGEGATLRAHVPHVMTLAGSGTIFGDPWQPPVGTSTGAGTRLSPADAAWLFRWAEPSVPDGWTSRRGTEAAPGTWVLVRLPCDAKARTSSPRRASPRSRSKRRRSRRRRSSRRSVRT